MIYLHLFWSFFRVGLFSFGGGYAALPLIQDQVTVKNAWLTMSEFLDLVTISQMTPGPIALNASTFVGLRVGGLAGAVAATFGCVFPSCVIVSIIAALYAKHGKIGAVQGVLGGLRPVVAAMIASAGLSMFIAALWGGAAVTDLSTLDVFAVGIFAVCFAVLRRFKPNPIWVMLGAGAVGAVVYLLL